MIRFVYCLLAELFDRTKLFNIGSDWMKNLTGQIELTPQK